ncbi:MAG: glycosyltransferase [Magnetospiraceae bacterium]
MRILFATAFFPPFAPKAATRAPALARYLLDQGQDIRVLGARNTLVNAVLSHRIPDALIVQAPVTEPRETAPRDPAPGDPAGAGLRLAAAARAAFGVPDKRGGWIPHAVAMGKTSFGDWRPDLILTSVPPHAGLFVAAALADHFKAPWIADFRDLWVDHPYYEETGLRARLDGLLQERVMGSAAGFTTVTAGWTDLLKQKYGKPVACVLNGFDAGDFIDPVPAPGPDGPLTLIYGGGIYGGKRDPRPLFAAIQKLGWGPDQIRVTFHVDDETAVQSWAEAAGIAATVEIAGLVPRENLLLKQRQSDLLLLLRWDSPSEDHVVAGKLFEYIGCRRPILSVGRESGEAARIIETHALGVLSNDPDRIADHLAGWWQQKQAGGIPTPGTTIPEEFSREHQFARMLGFFQEVAGRAD